MFKNLFSILLLSFISVNCHSTQENAGNLSDALSSDSSLQIIEKPVEIQEVIVGASRFEAYLGLLEGKSVAMVVNQTSVVDGEHLVDLLLSKGIQVKKIFAPEHGFRGDADAGATIKNGHDSKTGLPIISLYGKNKKPSSSHLMGIDVVLFDIQDVGARFYTYISSMHYVMEACAENRKAFIVLDRPNPNGHYVDGPILKKSQKSFVGMHKVPIVHGMTVGEYAQMVNGERWLKNRVECDLTIITCKNYDHTTFYDLPIKPSPNLPNIRSIYLYPSLCLFEGTVVSVGRGTPTPFQIYGHPNYKEGTFKFRPKPTSGASKPKHNGKKCTGFSFLEEDITTLREKRELNLDYLIDFYENMPNKNKFFTSFFKKLAGTTQLEQQIKAGLSAKEIRATWEEGLMEFKMMRDQYLLYKDF